MKIGIDITPISKDSKHKVRGSGFYLQHLKDSLSENYPENEYHYFTKTEKLNAEVNVVHYPYFEPFFLTLPYKYKYPTVVTVHDLIPIAFKNEFPIGLKGSIKWNLQKHLLQKAEKIITDSNHSKNDILKFLNIPEKKVSVIPLAPAEHFKKREISRDEKNNLYNKYHIPEKFMLYVGDVTSNKNLPRLVKACINTNLSLVMVGKSLVETNFDHRNLWNKDRIEIQKLAKDNNNIILLGFVPDEDLVALYNMTSVFVMPSLSEGFGLPVLEAMSCGAPVVTSKGGSLPEVAGDAALYVDAYNEKDLAIKFQEVFNNISLQKKLSDLGLKRAAQFTWKKTAELTQLVYKELL